jgi:DNA-binding XRE family transcriptional regulator
MVNESFTIRVGSVVRIKNGSRKDEWRVIPSEEGDAATGSIPADSPMARALLGYRVRGADELVERARRHPTGSLASASARRPNERLRMQRQQHAWTQADVAEKLHRLADSLGGAELGVDATMVGRWERGTRTPRPRYARLLCRLFDASVEELGLGPGPQDRWPVLILCCD